MRRHDRSTLAVATSGLLVALLAAGCGGPGGETAQPAAAAAPAPTGPGPHVKVLETRPLHIDQLYPSMTGPFDRIPLDVSDVDWVTAFRTEVVDETTGAPLGDEFFCHSQVQLPNTVRLMVAATGIDELRFPPGYAMPFHRILEPMPAGQRELTFLGMVLNNHEPVIDRRARVKAELEYWRDEDPVRPPFRKLFKVTLPLTVEDLAAYTPQDRGHGTVDDVTTHCELVDGLKYHWLVPPGPQRTRKEFRDLLPVDATVHYAAVHLHNYGRYVRLTDKTTGEVLWQTDVVYEPERLQIAKIPAYSSVEGFPMYADHVYEIEAFYDNTSDRDVDAMASLYLYYRPAGDVDIYYPTGPAPAPES